MLNAVRRSPASIVRSSHSPSVLAICVRSTHFRPLSRSVCRSLSTPSLIRQFSVSPFARQKAAYAETIEDDIADEVTAQRPPSDAQIDEAVQHGPVTRFKELGERQMVCPTVVRTLTEDMGLETMTQVQSLTINETLKGGDVLAQARTGTGKTLAFLIPVLQNIINYDPKLERRGYRQPRTSPDDIRAIIISPTRELAEQIAVEAKKLTRNTGVIVQTAVGGTQKSLGLRAIKTQGCHIMVGTPGRINDILSDPYSQVRAPDLSAFVLDEADRLLDQGFAPEIEAIQKLLPDRNDVDRQTLLFSATVPREVVEIVRKMAKPNFSFVRTVQDGEQQTHEKVPQKLAIIKGLENQIPALVELSKREIARKDEMPFKALVYFNATADVSLAATILRNLKNPGESIYHRHPFGSTKVFEIHARLSQRERTVAADAFRRADSAIMISSDVTARGMDFPNVTHVIQMGVPSDRDVYIHRIGRTGRSDKKGEGWIFLTPMEFQKAKQRLYDLPVEEDHTLETAKVDMTQDAQLPEDVAKILTQTIDASRMANFSLKSASYKASLGVTSWAPPRALIESLNRRAKYCWGLETPPKIAPALAKRLGLMRVPGVELGVDEDSGARFGGDRGGSFGNRGSFGDRSSFGNRDSSGDRGFSGDRGSFGDRGSSRGVFGSRGSERYGGGRERFGGPDRGRSRGRFDPLDRLGRSGDFEPASRYDRNERSGGFDQYRKREGELGAS